LDYQFVDGVNKFCLPADLRSVWEIGKALNTTIPSGSIETHKFCFIRQSSSGKLTTEFFERVTFATAPRGNILEFEVTHTGSS